jgi:hypothetical protein
MGPSVRSDSAIASIASIAVSFPERLTSPDDGFRQPATAAQE